MGSSRKMRGSIRPGLRTIGREVHVREDVALDVDAGRHLDQLHAVRVRAEDAALGHVEHRLARLRRVGAAEGDLLDRLHELAAAAFLHDAQLAVVDLDFEAAGGERAGEHHPARVLADVDEAARAGEPRAEAAHVDVAVGVDLGHAEARHVEAAAVVEVELLVLVEHAPRC